MENDLDFSVSEMLKRFGIKIYDNKNIFGTYRLPNVNKFKLYYPDFKYLSFENKIKFIKNFIYDNNHFRIANRHFFFPNLEISQPDEKHLIRFLNNLRIKFLDGNIKIVFLESNFSVIEKLLINKIFLKEFAKDFQIQSIFLNNEQTNQKLVSELINSISRKLIETGLKEIANNELPKLILTSLEIELNKNTST
jgi:hypothetical protein